MFYNKFCPKNSPPTKIDLHIHTTASDGAYRPSQIIKLAVQKGISLLSITDHDTIAGLEEGERECIRQQINFLPGIEFSTIYENNEIHILGYQIIPTNKELCEFISLLQKSRSLRLQKMVQKLNKQGIILDFREVIKKAKSNNLSRVHLALVLMDKGIVNSLAEAMEKFLSPACPAFVPRDKFSPSDAIQLIKKAGGVPVLAHPGLINCDKLIPSLIKMGLQGIEVFHPRHNPKKRQLYWQISQNYALLATGGSDFHGHIREDFINLGEMGVPLQTITQLNRHQHLANS